MHPSSARIRMHTCTISPAILRTCLTFCTPPLPSQWWRARPWWPWRPRWPWPPPRERRGGARGRGARRGRPLRPWRPRWPWRPWPRRRLPSPQARVRAPRWHRPRVRLLQGLAMRGELKEGAGLTAEGATCTAREARGLLLNQGVCYFHVGVDGHARATYISTDSLLALAPTTQLGAAMRPRSAAALAAATGALRARRTRSK